MMRLMSVSKPRQLQYIMITVLLFSLGCSSISVSTQAPIEKRKYRRGHYVKAAKQVNRLVQAECEKRTADPGSTPRNDSTRLVPLCHNSAATAASHQPSEHNSIRIRPFKSVNHDRVSPVKTKKTTRPGSVSDPEQSRKPVNPPETVENKGLAGVLGFYCSLIGLFIPAASPVAVAICVADMRGVGVGYSIIGFILGIIEFAGWAILAAFLFTAGFMIWGWIIAALLFAGLLFAILLVAGAFW
jgi:hypothetical protein